MASRGRRGRNPYSAKETNVLAALGKDQSETLYSKGGALSADEVGSILLNRGVAGLSYTSIGVRVVVYLHTGKLNYFDSTVDFNVYFSSCVPHFPSFSPKKVSPHALSLIGEAYEHILGEGENQVILIQGEIGSGQMLSEYFVMKFFYELEKVLLPGNLYRVSDSAERLWYIMSAFTCVTTSTDPNACFNLGYTEYQINSSGTLVGLQHIQYFLHKGTVVGKNVFGRNYNIFHMLVSQKTPEDNYLLELGVDDDFRYTPKSKLVTQLDLSVLKQHLEHVVGEEGVNSLCELLAGILHLGNVEFEDPVSGLKSDPCEIKNSHSLDLAAAKFGLRQFDLAASLINRIKVIGRDLSHVILDKKGCEKQRDSLAHTVYSVMVWWIIERINSSSYKQEDLPVLSILNTGFIRELEKPLNLEALIMNYANERITGFLSDMFYALPKKAFTLEELTKVADNLQEMNDKTVLDFMVPKFFDIVEMNSIENEKDAKTTEDLSALIKQQKSPVGGKRPAYINSKKNCFTISHYCGDVLYTTKDLSALNTDTIQEIFVQIFQGCHYFPGPNNAFIKNIFVNFSKTGNFTKLESQLGTSANVMGRSPSIKRKKKNVKNKNDTKIDLAKAITSTRTHQIKNSLEELLETLSDSPLWCIYHLRHLTSSKIDIAVNDPEQISKISRQVESHKLQALTNNPSVLFTSALPYEIFLETFGTRYLVSGNKEDALKHLIRMGRVNEEDVMLGKNRIFLTSEYWWRTESRGIRDTVSKMLEKEIEKRMNTKEEPRAIDPVYPEEDVQDLPEEYDQEEQLREEIYEEPIEEPIEEPPVIPFLEDKKVANKGCTKRSYWMCLVYSCTFCIPSYTMSICGMKTRERRTAWREKITLFSCIVLLNILALLLIVGLNIILCPSSNTLSIGQISEHNKFNSEALVYMYGRYFYVFDILKSGIHSEYVSSKYLWEAYILGRDVSYMFDREDPEFWPRACPFDRPANGFAFASAYYKYSPTDDYYPHSPGLFNRLNRLKNSGDVVWALQNIVSLNESEGRRLLTLYDQVYDVTGFFYINVSKEKTFLDEAYRDTHFIYNVFNRYTKGDFLGVDAGKEFDKIRMDQPKVFDKIMTCMNNLFRVGKVDHRNSTGCKVYSGMLLAISVSIGLLLLLKFAAAFHSRGQYNPDQQHRFVICQVPCYTEDEDSIKRTIDSIALLNYEHGHKLLFVICDGMIVGSGNDISTPRIVLNMLGVPMDEDPEPLIFKSTGKGMMQLNTAKVYYGVYQISGKSCPFIVVVKVGTSDEMFRPGNRGKRDSQLILMQFLCKLHTGLPLNPLELRLCYIMRNVIGVDPRFYEYLLMVDSDTEIHEDSLSHLVSAMVDDVNVVGVCGETTITNEKESWVTMIQVYEYFLSHKMYKAFESLFGCVTCLPGCFCMYRIYNPTLNQTYLVNKKVVKAYSKSDVSTLHSLNLLELGEDRYLTTLMLKHFPRMNTIFCPHAKANTIVPTKWKVLFSQRRRWVNSTIHNLFELLLLDDTCGGCLCSLRTVVFIELIGTFIQPATLGYIAYLIYINVTVKESQIPLVLIITLCLIYVLQIALFIYQKEWQYIGWLIIYILAIVLFGTFIPLYAFWKFDDFSWGNTRVASDEKGTKPKQLSTIPFDHKLIPLSEYENYENEIIEYQAAMRAAEEEDAMARAQSYQQSEYPQEEYSYISTTSNAERDSRSVYSAGKKQNFAIVEKPKKLPSDEAILNRIRIMLASADLSKVTKRFVREELSAHFRVDLSSKKNWISRCIDEILRGEI